MIPTLVLFGGFLVFLGVGIPIPFALILSSLVVFLMNPANSSCTFAHFRVLEVNGRFQQQIQQ